MSLLKTLSIFLTIIAISNSSQASDKVLNIAVASNFTNTLQDIVSSYQDLHPRNNIKLKVIPGSTTNLYSQIINGAPFDIFFAANKKHIDLLIKQNLAKEQGSFIYAKGKLVLWAPKHNINNSAKKFLEANKFTHLAIAKPEFAPYGKAAKEVLKKLKLFNILKSNNKLIYSQNVSGVMNYTANNNVDLGFVALSQIIFWQKKHDVNLENNIWHVPENFYSDILQKTAILTKSNKENAQKFLDFVKSKKSQDIISAYGYETINH